MWFGNFYLSFKTPNLKYMQQSKLIQTILHRKLEIIIMLGSNSNLLKVFNFGIIDVESTHLIQDRRPPWAYFEV